MPEYLRLAVEALPNPGTEGGWDQRLAEGVTTLNGAIKGELDGRGAWLGQLFRALDPQPDHGGRTWPHRLVGGGLRQLWEDVAATSFDVHVDSIDGDDGNDGLTPQTALATFGAVVQVAGMKIGLRNGSQFRESMVLTEDGISVTGYGTGPVPTFIGSTLVETVWTNVGGNVWSTPLGASPTNWYLVTGYAHDEIARLEKNTATPDEPVAGQWGFDTDAAYVYSTIDPNDEIYEHATDTGTGGGLIYPQADDITVTRVAALMSPRNGCYVGAGVDRFKLFHSDCSWAVNDNVGGHPAAACPKDALIWGCTLWGAGYSTAKSISGSDGDGIAFHGNNDNDYSSCTLMFNDIRKCRKSGIGNQTAVVCFAYGNLIDECFVAVQLFGTGYTGDVPMVQTHAYFIIRRTGTDQRGISLEATLTHEIEINLYNGTLYSTVASANIPAIHCSTAAAGATNMSVRMRNLIITGFGRGIQSVNDVPALDLDHNCLFGNTSNYFDQGTRTPSLASLAGANSMIADPLLADPASGDFRLGEGSPCIGAGEALGYTEDQAGDPVPSIPSIGALELVAA